MILFCVLCPIITHNRVSLDDFIVFALNKKSKREKKEIQRTH